MSRSSHPDCRATVGVGSEISASVRQVIDSVEKCNVSNGGQGVAQKEIVSHLGIDKGTVSRNVREAISAGYLQNLEDQRGVEHRIIIDNPLPGDAKVLPTLADLKRN